MPELEAGRIFERYRIIRVLGSGASGESYEAEDTMLQRKVTLKLIHPWMTLPDSARRQFFREMQVISVFHSPYLASVLDYGEIDGKLYVARRYVTSGSLLGNEGRIWFRPPLSIPDAIQYCHQLSQSLQYIHDHQYVHGSLTFSNILVLRGPNSGNEVDYAPFLLADVGLACFVRRFGQPQLAVLPITAAPEQIGKRTTPASDQFALAVLLYFWLTGRPPYLGTPDEIEQQKLTETITPLRSLNSMITIEQEAILLRALSVYPEERYPSILAFANALLHTTGSQAEPTPQPAPAPDPIPEHEPDTPTPQIIPEPTPQTVPDVPQPLPEPEKPTPLPEPAPQPAPKPDVPQPEPDPIPMPAPDIPQPLPGPEFPEILPGTTPQTEPLAGEILDGYHEQSSHLHNVQDAISPRLIITSPYTQEPYEILLELEETTLGRAGSSDILLDRDNSTSRHHALLKCENDQYVLYDQRSANGVFVNGQKLSEDTGYILTDGDHISVGNYELIFRFSMPHALNEAGRDDVAAMSISSSLLREM